MNPIGICTNFMGPETYSAHAEDFSLFACHFDHVELPAMTLEAMAEADYALLCQQAQEARLDLHTMTNLFPPAQRLMDGEDSQIAAYLDRMLPRCSKLGCKRLVFGSGKARSLLPGQTPEEGYRRLGSLIRQVILPRFREYGIELIMEPLNPGICNFILTLPESAVLSDYAGQALPMLADSLHLMDQPSIAEDIRQYRDLIAHVHLSEAGRAAPLTGVSPALQAFLHALKLSGYSGPMSFECRFACEEEMALARTNVEGFL